MVTAESDDAGQGFALFGGALCLRVRCRGARKDRVVALFDLLDRIGIVVSVSSWCQSAGQIVQC